MRAKFINEDERYRKWTPEEERRTRSTTVMGSGGGSRPVTGTPSPRYKSSPIVKAPKVKIPREPKPKIKYLTQKQYESVLKGAVTDTFNQARYDAKSDNVEVSYDEIHDMAQSMIEDDELKNYLTRRFKRDYGSEPLGGELVDELVNDMQRFA